MPTTQGQTTGNAHIFPKMFFSAQAGRALPEGDLPEDGVKRAIDFQVEYTLLQRHFGIGCTFIKAKHDTDIRNVDPNQMLVHNGTLEYIEGWEYQAFVLGPVIALPFGRKHPGLAYLKAQLGILRAKCPSRFYDNEILFSDYDSALGMHLGLGFYWTIVGPMALTVGGSLLEGNTAFALPTGYPIRSITPYESKLGVLRFGVGLLFWFQ